jgi:hypothetical protein
MDEAEERQWLTLGREAEDVLRGSGQGSEPKRRRVISSKRLGGWEWNA